MRIGNINYTMNEEGNLSFTEEFKNWPSIMRADIYQDILAQISQLYQDSLKEMKNEWEASQKDSADGEA